jgi:hypothetical protein
MKERPSTFREKTRGGMGKKKMETDIPDRANDR